MSTAEEEAHKSTHKTSTSSSSHRDKENVFNESGDDDTAATTATSTTSTKLDELDNNKSTAMTTRTVPVSTGGNPLEYAYSFWFSKRPGKGSLAASSAANSSSGGHPINYDANLRMVGTFNSVESFWNYYVHMSRPHDILGHADIHMFKDGIRPLWEDDANKNGGKWIVRLKKGLASRCWENLILAILGEQFMVGEEICGAVVSVRFAVRST